MKPSWDTCDCTLLPCLVLNLWSTACCDITRPAWLRLGPIGSEAWHSGGAHRAPADVTSSDRRFSSLLPLLGFTVWSAPGSLGVGVGNGSRFVANYKSCCGPAGLKEESETGSVDVWAGGFKKQGLERIGEDYAEFEIFGIRVNPKLLPSDLCHIYLTFRVHFRYILWKACHTREL